MPSRRKLLSNALATAAGLAWLSRHPAAFADEPAAQDRAPLREVLRRFFAGGATLIDTAPSYGSAEDVLGDLLIDLLA